jgi:hypothetical protein
MRAELIRVKSLWLALFILISFQAHAVITIQSVGGVSHFEQDLNNNNFTIYGGMAGVCVGDGATTCNSCNNAGVGTSIQACNMANVYPTLPISITFVSDQSVTNARIKITTEEQLTTTEAVEYSITNPYVTASAGTAITVSVKWSYLCAHDTGFSMSESCTPNPTTEAAFANPSRKIYVYLDENSDGTLADTEKKSVDVKLHYLKADEATLATQTFCNAPNPASIGLCGFKLGIGDSKFYLQQLFGADSSGVGTAPPKSSTNAPDWYGLAFKAEPATDLNSISSAGGFQIRNYNATYGIDDNTVTGLQNYTNYCLLMGNINKAQNIYKFNNQGALAGDVCGQPSEVIGMLTDKSCFISTAAFGSDMADQVQLLRQFRNKFLLTNEYGKVFVKTYYQLSPPIAHFIERSEILKAMTRSALYPFIAMAWLVVNVGFLPTALLVLFVFSSLYFLFKKRRALHV